MGIEAPYLAFVGTLEPRKNLPALVDAFACVAAEAPRLRLVLAGQPGWGSDAVDRAVAQSGVADRVVRPGYLPDDTLPALLRRAEAVVYPSHEEGFGLPPAEAMALGVAATQAQFSATGTRPSRVPGSAMKSAVLAALLSRLRSRTARLVAAATVASAVLLIQTPALAHALHLEPLGPADWAVVVACSVLAPSVPLMLDRLWRRDGS